MLKKFLENFKMTAGIALLIPFGVIIVFGGVILFPNNFFISIVWFIVGLFVFAATAYTVLEKYV